MEWIERLNDVIKYIEQHLTDEIEYEQLSKITCCSTYHFQRIFSYVAGIPISEYIRRRRMSMAAADLQNSDEKIIDIALKYGYNSPTAFNRAFRSVHKISPSKARLSGTILKSFLPISFKLTIKGDIEMDYRIEKKEAFKIVGVSMPLSKEMEKNFGEVPKMWQKLMNDGTLEKLANMIEIEPKGMLGVNACSEEDNWRYFIAVATNKPTNKEFEELIIPEMTWAIFYGEGTMPDSIQSLEKRIFTEWIPTSGYEYANAPDIEVYFSPNPQDAKFEIWVPVNKKQSKN